MKSMDLSIQKNSIQMLLKQVKNHTQIFLFALMNV